jgi:hypothetical protein
MANRYGEAALMAARMETYGKALTPAERWQDAVMKLYPTSPIGQKKAAPRNAFVGLCEHGLVQGIRAAEGRSSPDKLAAVKAVELLRAGSHKTVTQLWAAVNEEEGKPHNSQMDVVLALWKNGLIVS